jgi:hypothetical protein
LASECVRVPVGYTIKDPVTHGERPHDPDPNLARFFLQVDQWLSKLRVDTQPPVEFLQGCDELFALATLPGNVRSSEQSLPHSFRVRHPIRRWWGYSNTHFDLARASTSARKASSCKPPVASISRTCARNEWHFHKL